MAGYRPKTIERWNRALRSFGRPAPAADPSTSALVVVDMQQYFAEIAAPALPAVRRAVSGCRQRGVRILFTQHGHADPALDGGMLERWWGDSIIEGTAEHALIPETGVLPEDPVVSKRRYDAFHETDLEAWLRRLGANDLAVCGVLTNLCVETTARSAFVRDFTVRILMDGTAAADERMHLAALTNLAYGFAYLQTADDYLRSFEGT